MTGIARIIPDDASWVQTLLDSVPPVLSGSKRMAKVVTVLDPTGGKPKDQGVWDRTRGKRRSTWRR